MATHRLVDVVEGMHHAIAKPWFSFAGPAADGLRRMHHVSTSATYGLVRLGGRAAGRAVDHRVPSDNTRAISASAIGSALWGDDPARPAVADATIQDNTGSVVLPLSGGLAASFPNANNGIIVLLHGLGQTERCWDTTMQSLDDRWSPVRIRYNTGLPIASSASEVAALLERLVEHWPVEIKEVVLVGYSMGGLVARSAANQAQLKGHRWVARTRHVTTVAAPLLGSPIEKGAEALASSLAIAPQTRPLAEFVGSRSQGIKDLRHGSPVDDVLPDHIEHHCIAAVVTENPRHPVGRALGDLVVRASSATGRGRSRSIEHSTMNVIGGRNHASALNAPELLVLLRSLLDEMEGEHRGAAALAQTPAQRTTLW
ncbi:MAG: alpha/beta fold hydrolase [Acidimicrobiales bacterium]|nr:alpha/beta fold hydrolase [Acidimicrobiales bacterium]